MRNLAKVLAVLVAMGSLTGCANVNALKQRNKELEDKYSAAQKQIKNLEEQNALLAEDNEELKAKLLSSPRESTKGLAKDLGPDVSVRTKGLATIIELPSKVFFASGSSNLSPHGKRSLKRVAGVLRSRFAGMMYRVEGHTDSDPIRLTKKKYKSNWELSSARAQAVLYYLVNSEGISPKQVCVVGYGQNQPLVPNTSAVNKSKNRRVEIVVVPR